MDEPRPTYRAIFGAYWGWLSETVEEWWLGFGVVQVCLFAAVVLARSPGALPPVAHQPVVSGLVVLAVVAFVVTLYDEFL